MNHILYLLLAAALALLVPAQTLDAGSRLFLVVGAIGLWRYGWAFINFCRALIYRHIVYPRFRRAAERTATETQSRSHAFFLVTSFKIETAVTVPVYDALFRAALESPHGATVVASVVDMADQRLIESIYRNVAGGGQGVTLDIVRIPGTGKRDALAVGLAAIRAHAPGPNDIVVLVDGDSCVPRDIAARAAPFFAFDAAIGALTTDELCEAQGSRLFRDWFALRFAQRHMTMCSMGLSRRVLTLTGRMSVFRASLACDPGFIAQIQHDEIEHWRLGRVKFLTGDDKSTWYWLLRRGFQMIYLPDVQSLSLETAPRPGFVESAGMLMARWFGNMLRNNGRALRLPPGRIGYFTWWSILDQRLSMWTTLTGPAGALLGSLFVDPFIMVAYLAWLMLSRYAFCLGLMLFRSELRISYPFLLYFNQIYGSLLKSYVFFRFDRQKWTRQQTQYGGQSGGASVALRGWSSAYMHGLTLAALATGVALLGGLLSVSPP